MKRIPKPSDMKNQAEVMVDAPIEDVTFLYRVYRRIYKTIYKSTAFQYLLDRWIRLLTGRALKKTHRTDEHYASYLYDQISKSYTQIRRSAGRYGVPQRTKTLVGLLDRALPEMRAGWTALSVGCRHVSELEYIEKTLGIDTQGLDLFSVDKKITVGDMHDMPFPDASFDVLYSCHSLEHAYDLDRAIEEFVRVTKAGGFITIEVPIKYELSSTDRWDVGSADGLLMYFQGNIAEVLVAEEHEDVTRVILQKSMKADRDFLATSER